MSGLRAAVKGPVFQMSGIRRETSRFEGSPGERPTVLGMHYLSLRVDGFEVLG